MTTHPLHPLADAIAKAIFTAVEKDRCLNLENIREAAFRELAVAEASRMLNAPVGISEDQIPEYAARMMKALAKQPPPLGGWNNEMDAAGRDLYRALSRKGLL